MLRFFSQAIQNSKMWGEEAYSYRIFGGVLIVVSLLSFLGYHTYIDNHYYTFDDYNTLFMGYGHSVQEQYLATLSWLADWGGRFQPVRLFSFGLFGHLVPEGETIWYALSLHGALLILFAFLLASFRVHPFLIFVTLLYFSLFGRWRLMDSLASTVAGGELILCFFLLSLLSLRRAVEASSLFNRRFFIALSWFSYALLVFSYEMAFPFIAPLLFYYLFLLMRKGERLSLVHLYPVIPYFLLLLLYLFCAEMLYKKVAYSGTSVVLNSDVFPRIVTYLYNSFTFKVTLKDMVPRWEWVPFLSSYFAVLWFLTRKSSGERLWGDNQPVLMVNPLWWLLCFASVFYLSSISLFVINNWGTPYQYMAHHAFEHTIGSSMVTVSALFLLAYRFSAEKQRVYRKALCWVVFPLLLLAGLNFHLRYGEAQMVRTMKIDLLKNAVLNEVKHPEDTDVIFLKNYYPPYDGISSLDGALTKWFGMKKKMLAGRDINKVGGAYITYTGNLTYYGDFSPETVMPKVENSRVAILYREPQRGEFLSYHSWVDNEKKENIFQSLHVFDRKKRAGYQVILKKEGAERYLIIHTRKGFPFQLRINGKEVSCYEEEKNIFAALLPLFRKPVRYYFIEIVSPSAGFSRDISRIALKEEK